ncbi:alpha/beta hydrolase [Streptomyces sp. SID4917]|nr:alpha/beta hydrolase [Streptomyces sp. SID4917]MYZ35364.1 hypothetical protein [Streptomyces sp. SID4917]
MADTGPAHKQLYLLGFSTEKDGRAIVAVGNPDTAEHTAIQVPGTSNQLDNVGSQINRAKKLQSSARAWSEDQGQGQRQGQDVSVISWLDYDAPEANERSRLPHSGGDSGGVRRGWSRGTWSSPGERPWQSRFRR